MTPSSVTMKDDALPQIHNLVRDTDLGAYLQHGPISCRGISAESEFNLRSLATNTGRILSLSWKNHIWLVDALSGPSYPSGELYRMAAMTEYFPAIAAFLFHTERKRGRTVVRGCP